MNDPLGKGLESLIPKKDEPPAEPAALPVIESQPVPPPAKAPQPPAASAFAASQPLRSEPPARQPRREESVFWIDVSKIEPNPQQPRRVFDIDELAALTASVREHGVLQPLVVTKREIERPGGFDVRYELIAGERRWRAAKLAGMRDVPVIIRTAETSERAKLELALIENVQREDLNPMERAHAFAKLVEEFGLMQKDVADRIGKSREVVANALRLLRLPSDMQEAILASAISESHARVLLTLEHDPSSQRRLFDEIRTGSLSVRDAEFSARAIGTPSSAVRRGRPMLDPDTRVLQKRLEEALGTRVKLSKRGEHGRIIVEFFSDEELRGILERISKKEEGYV